MQHKTDFSGLTDFTNGDKAFSTRLLTAFQTELKELLEILSKLPRSGDFPAVSKKYHSVKPSLQMLRLHTLTDTIAEYRIACASVTDPAEPGPEKIMNEIYLLSADLQSDIQHYLESLS